MTGIIARFSCWMLVVVALLATPIASYAQIGFGISVSVAPPELPFYEQPPCPDEGYIWTPGYWAYGDDDYYWVPGTWVLAPRPGYLWTPGYWGWGGDGYMFHAGYWGEHIGFYGGINYGYGYFGDGYDGGYWDRGVFNYNTAVNNVNTTVVNNIYNQTVVNNNTTVNNISYSGGAGGIAAQPTATQLVAARERHIQPTNLQVSHEYAAKKDPSQYVKVNAGKPVVAATPKPGIFQGRGVVSAAKTGRVPQSTTNVANGNTANNRSGNSNGISKTAINARADRPTAAQRPPADNINRPNSTGARTLDRNKPIVGNNKGANAFTTRSDRPPFAQHNSTNATASTSGGNSANGVSSRTAPNRWSSPQRNDRPAWANSKNDTGLSASNRSNRPPAGNTVQTYNNRPSSSSSHPSEVRSLSSPTYPPAKRGYSAPSHQSASSVSRDAYPAQRQPTTPQRSYSAPTQRSYSAPAQRSYAPQAPRQPATPQRSYSAPTQRSYSAPAQRSYAPQAPREPVTPQRSYSAPAQRSYAPQAPRQPAAARPSYPVPASRQGPSIPTGSSQQNNSDPHSKH
jgi:hypothetical protein